MFWMARNGDVLQTQPPEVKAPHANWSNNCSIGCEMVVPTFGYVKGKYSEAAQKQAAIGVVVIGKHADPVKGLKTSKKALAWHGHYCMPAELQMRRMWEGTNGYWWSGDRGTPSCTKPNQQGVTSHARWPSHGDGCVIEYYCFASSRGFSSVEAYKMAALSVAVCGGNVINGIRSPAGYRTCPLPNAEMAAAAKSWGGNRPLKACTDSVDIKGAPITEGNAAILNQTAAVGDPGMSHVEGMIQCADGSMNYPGMCPAVA